jgi:catechol 2,3-dioxygenase-like lactoylglutathione lyase family enzyme
MTGAKAPAVQSIHHFAYKCRDAEETRHFYEDILGLPLTMVIEEKDARTTTGDTLSFVHFFFELADGGCIAFFDFGDNKAVKPDPETPRFANHLAMKVNGEDELLAAKARLEAHGLQVDGPLQHECIRSVYFWDPNGIRLEYAYTVDTPGAAESYRKAAGPALRDWVARTRAGRAAAAS